MALGFVLLIVGVLSYQINAFRGTPSGQALLANVLGPDGLRGIEQWAGLVGRLAFGQLYETLVILVLAVASFGAVGLYFWDRFADDAAIMAGQAQHHPKVRQGTERIRFLTGLYAVSIVKEWRSMLRDPLVLTQVATPLVSLIPLGISLYMSQHLGSPLPPESNLGIAGLVLVLFGSQITGTLAWTAASIEEAGDLLMSSPADGGHLFWSKALATAIPCFAFLFFGMVAVAFFDVQVGFLGLLVGSCGLACAGAIEFLRPRPARRVKMTQRPDRSIVSVLLGFLFSLNWSVATALAMWGAGLWTLIPIGLGVLALIFVAKTAPKA
jgi:hypothetical protein